LLFLFFTQDIAHGERRIGPHVPVNVLDDGLQLAGFQVSPTGRFWVSPEEIQKNTEPTASLALDFNINSGEMKINLASAIGKLSSSIRLDVEDDRPVYYFDGKKHSAESLADLLIEPLLSATEPVAVGRKIGFV